MAEEAHHAGEAYVESTIQDAGAPTSDSAPRDLWLAVIGCHHAFTNRAAVDHLGGEGVKRIEFKVPFALTKCQYDVTVAVHTAKRRIPVQDASSVPPSDPTRFLLTDDPPSTEEK